MEVEAEADTDAEVDWPRLATSCPTRGTVQVRATNSHTGNGGRRGLIRVAVVAVWWLLKL